MRTLRKSGAEAPRGLKSAPQGERGFALLIVFLMAAAVALMMYQQMPRIAFESEREKEQLLISRGEQYKRAIQMYFVAYKKWPTKIEDLEATNNKRYLRKRYIDPMTGKDEWRLIHVNAGGQLTDSLVTKPPTPDGKNGTQNASNASGATGASGASGASGADGPPDINAAVRQRPSDRTLLAGNNQPPQNVDPNDQRYWPPISLTPSGASGAPGQQQFQGQQFPGQQIPGQQGQNPQFPGQQIPGQQGQVPQFPGQQLPGQQFPGQQFPGQPGSGQPGFPPGFQPGIPGQQGFNPLQQGNPQQGGLPTGQGQIGQTVPIPNMPGQGINLQTGAIQPGGQQGAPGGPVNPAVGMINDMLRNPRPDPNAAGANNNLAAGGVVGVASTYKGPSIKIYKERQKYQEWEFIFDLKSGMPGQQGAPANPAGTQAQPGGGGPGMPGGLPQPSQQQPLQTQRP